MKKIRLVVISLLAIVMILPSSKITFKANEKVETSENQVVRFGDKDRYETAIKVSQQAYPNGASTVVIAGVSKEVDALTGTLLAYYKKAPLLLTQTNKLSPQTKEEILRLNAQNIIVLGGQTVVSEKVVMELEALENVEVSRIFGDDRYQTAYKAAMEVKKDLSHVFLALGDDNLLADAMSVGPISALRNMPILLSKKDQLPKQTVTGLKALGVTHITIVGGEGAISKKIEKELEKDYVVERIAGLNREDTAIRIASKYLPNVKNAMLAYGYKYVDSLVGGYLGAMYQAPILLTDTNSMKKSVNDYLENHISKVNVLGGEAVIAKNVYNKVAATVGIVGTKDKIISENTSLKENYTTLKITEDNIVLDLNFFTVENLTILGDNTTIKNGTIFNIKIDKGVKNVVFEDVVDLGDGEHIFEGGGEFSITLKGKTHLRNIIYLRNMSPLQIKKDNLQAKKGLKGKIIVDSDQKITIATAVEELEIVKTNNNIYIKDQVKKVTALSKTKLFIDFDIDKPYLQKAAGVNASAQSIDNNNNIIEYEFIVNNDLIQTETIDTTPPPPPSVIAADSITLSPKNLDILLGTSETVTFSILPTNATNKAVTWTTSDENIASVDNGLVVAIGVGSATITATTVDGNKLDTVSVNVILHNPDYEGAADGQFKYIGSDTEVEIPHVINGIPLTSYKEMFFRTEVLKVKSTSPNIVSMESMFNQGKSATLDLSELDTSSVTNMKEMFNRNQTTSLDLSNFNTSKVTTMEEMFFLNKAASLDLSSFDTLNVTNMNGMFSAAEFESLDISNFNTSNVTNMKSMFKETTINDLDLSMFNTSKVTDMSSMFSMNKSKTIDLSSFDTSNVTNMESMFYLNKTNNLDLSNFDTSNVTGMDSMFRESWANVLDLSSFDTTNVTSTTDMFRDCAAKVGYAKTQADADRFNASSNKPETLNFVVKPLSDAEKLQYSKETLNFDYLDEVVADITLPTNHHYATVSWMSDNPDIISNSGTVTRPEQGEGNVSVNLTATLTVGSESDTKIITLIVKEKEIPQYSLTFLGDGISRTPAANLIEENTEVVVTVNPAFGLAVREFKVEISEPYSNENKVSELVAVGENTFKYTFNITANTQIQVLYKDIKVTGITLDKFEMTLEAGKEVGEIIPTIMPHNAKNQYVYWSSSDEDVASVENGVVTPKAAGVVQITAHTDDGSHTAVCQVTVVESR